MAQLSTLIIAGAVLLGAVQATELHVSQGCIIVNADQDLCGESTTTIDPDGTVAIYSCFENPEGDNLMDKKPNCNMIAQVPKEWGDAYFAEDNCLYSAGPDPTKLQCME